MSSIRYAARPVEQQRNREIEAVQTEIWSTALTVVFETDPDAIASVLPPPLEPSPQSTARLRFATVDMGTGLKPFGATAKLTVYFVGSLCHAIEDAAKSLDSCDKPLAVFGHDSGLLDLLDPSRSNRIVQLR